MNKHQLNQSKIITDLAFREHRKLTRSINKMKETLDKIQYSTIEKKAFKDDVYHRLDLIQDSMKNLYPLLLDIGGTHNVTYLQFVLCRVLVYERQHTVNHMRNGQGYDWHTLRRIVDDLSDFGEELMTILDERTDNEQGWELDYPDHT